jgi:DNA-binding CsgD family transcriptional regulator
MSAVDYPTQLTWKVVAPSDEAQEAMLRHLQNGGFRVLSSDGPPPATAVGIVTPVIQITPTERQVLRLVATAGRTRTIAEILGVSRRTVDNHIGHLLRKLGVHRRSELVERARALSLMDENPGT